MSIKEKLKEKLDYIVVFLTVILAIGSAFFVGRLSMAEKGAAPIQIRNLEAAAELPLLPEEGAGGGALSNSESDQPKYGMFAASINSSVYHFWKCPSVARIKDENLLWFDSSAEAEAEGKTPAADCKEEIGKAKENEQINTD